MNNMYSTTVKKVCYFRQILRMNIKYVSHAITYSYTTIIMKSTEVQTLGVMAAVYALRMTLC